MDPREPAPHNWATSLPDGLAKGRVKWTCSDATQTTLPLEPANAGARWTRAGPAWDPRGTGVGPAGPAQDPRGVTHDTVEQLPRTSNTGLLSRL